MEPEICAREIDPVRTVGTEVDSSGLLPAKFDANPKQNKAEKNKIARRNLASQSELGRISGST